MSRLTRILVWSLLTPEPPDKQLSMDVDLDEGAILPVSADDPVLNPVQVPERVVGPASGEASGGLTKASHVGVTLSHYLRFDLFWMDIKQMEMSASQPLTKASMSMTSSILKVTESKNSRGWLPSDPLRQCTVAEKGDPMATARLPGERLVQHCTLKWLQPWWSTNSTHWNLEIRIINVLWKPWKWIHVSLTFWIFGCEHGHLFLRKSR